MERPGPLDRDVQYLKGVGPRRAEILARLGIQTARDLLLHTPRRYEDASTVTPIAQLETGMEATVVGRVVSKGVLPTRRGLRIFQAVIKDKSGLLECSWPGQPFLDRVIQRGDLLLASGPIRFFHGRQIQPREYTILAGEGETAPMGRGKVFPVYAATEGITHRHIRGLIAENLEELAAAVAEEEVIPEPLRRRARVPELAEALRQMHEPDSLEHAEGGRRRLALEELFFLQLIHARSRWQSTRADRGIAFRSGGEHVAGLKASLPFELTGAQKRVLTEIWADMTSERRMNRLLQGDVGSGKTVVALFAALLAIDNDYQAALMAPTEILAEQHARTLAQLLEGSGIEVALLLGRQSAAERREILPRIEDGRSRLVVGTHAVIQDAVTFARLGLAIVDEQHRFGVRQRLALSEMGDNPDVLVMSATPIPRSLAMTLYGDLDLSIIDEKPPGRIPIRTAIRRSSDLPNIWNFLRDEIQAGRQAYVVYPLVEESEKVDLKAATEQFESLRTEVFADHRLALLHGKMSGEEKDAVMQRFAAGEIDILVSTTVIEVGIDVPNATVMVIEHAERFGLSQLHQLRGRVGRGGDSSYCIAVSEMGPALERLRVFAGSEDGFVIAEADLRLRGQGDLFGARQSGLPEFRWASLETDVDLLEMARAGAQEMIQKDPALTDHPEIRAAVRRRYADREDFFRTG